MSQASKQAFAVRMAVEEILRKGDSPIFATFTFSEAITDKKEADIRWRRLRERIRRKRPNLRAVGMWQRTKTGRWHLHLVIDAFLDVIWLRPVAEECGFGRQMELKNVRRRGHRETSAVDVARYMTRYLVRDAEERPEEDRHVRLPVFIGPRVRVCTCRLGWARGMAKLYRLGREWYRNLFDGIPTFEEYWLVVRLGWESLLQTEQDQMIEESEAVARWWSPERYPF